MKARRYCDGDGDGGSGGGFGGSKVPGVPEKAPRPNFKDTPDEELDLRAHPVGAGVTGPAERALGVLRWFALGGCLVGFMLVGANMAIKHRRSEAGEHAAGLSWVLLATAMAGAGVATGFISLLFGS